MPTSTDWDGMLSDVQSEFGATVTLRSIVAGSLVPLTGKRPETSTSVSVSAARVTIDPATFAIGEGDSGDAETVAYSFRVADLGGVEPKAEDEVVDGSLAYCVVSASKRCAGREWYVVCRGVRK